MPPERAQWEWRRVKRSFKGIERKRMIDDLQYWNTALKNCFERPEIPSAESDPMVKEIQARFNAKDCDTVRAHAQAIHSMIEAGWNCDGEHSHPALLALG